MATLQGPVVTFLALLMATAAAGTQFKVGGSNGWTVPTDPNAMSYNQWAERNRFKIGDSLLFVYSPGKDSVLQVDKAAYENCNTAKYIRRFDDGNTVVTLDRSGSFYFISGVEGNCIKNESLVVVVLGSRSYSSSIPPSPPPSPSKSKEVAPSPVPAAENSTLPSPPSPPPPPPPSPSSSAELAPSPPPAAEQMAPPPPPNGASTKVVGFMGCVGTLLSYLLVL